MTLSASFFSYLSASWCDLDVVFEPTGGEVIGMPEAIARLCRVFANESRRRVAIIADGYSSMTRFHPAVKLLPHDVTISATLSVIRQVRITASVDEGVRTDTYGQTEGNSKNYPLRQAKSHHVAPLKPIRL